MPNAPSLLDRPESPPAATRLRRWTLLAVALGTFMTYLDNNVINVAIPSIQRDLHLSASGIEWVVSAYILAFAGLLLAGGRLGDVAGHKRSFLLGLTLFTGASLLAGLSGDMHLLVASRALQGIGAAMLTPTSLAIITTTFPETREQARAIGVWAAVGALALAVGPLLGGILSQHLSWHWIFFINVPIGVATLALGARTIEERRTVVRRRLDLPGVALSTGALIGLTYSLIQGPQSGWTNPLVLTGLGVAAVLGTAFVIVERRATDPMLELGVFGDRSFTGGIMALGLWAFGLFGIYFFTSLYLQNVLGFSASKAGVAFVPMAALMAAGAAVSDRVAPRVGAHRLVGAAMALMGLGILSVSLLGRNATFGDLMPGFAVIGIGGGLTIPLTSTVVSAMPAERAGVASAVFNASREVSGLLGITVIGVILSARQHAEARLGASSLHAFLSGYRLGLVVAGALVIAGGAMAWGALRRVAPVAGAPEIVVAGEPSTPVGMA
ncbi:MAG: MFS transporter [Acidimicrobiaceae bacterium]|nr:MFS transporter [Acidimicrobiaceae bacterium]